ncbi:MULTISPECIES: hypothetical protein [Sphingomonas]|uniref:hypothetical protein n=1 Tax=Sphingomonas TaxID=13687 RepID=UPI00126A2CA1|nr:MULTISPECIES: hypothetical protein [Sphingomonas]
MPKGAKDEVPPTEIIGTIGRCIYCFRQPPDVPPLTDEHVIPSSLGGHRVLEDASCLDCAKITCKANEACCRKLWRSLREHHLFPSSKRKPGKGTVLVGTINNDDDPLREVPSQDNAALSMLPVLAPPGILRGCEPGAPSLIAAIPYLIPTAPEHLVGQDPRGLHSIIIPLSEFYMLLAQIAHGYLVTHGFWNEGDLLPQAVLGRADLFGYLMGGTDDRYLILQPTSRQFHQVSAFNLAINGQGYIGCQIRLFSHLVRSGAPLPPTYTVIGPKRDLPKGEAYFDFVFEGPSQSVNVNLLTPDA